jgi:glyoxylase-like metal-dependent hydrolase (beta-lactamase superfamily II)
MGLRNARTVLGEVAKVSKSKTLYLTVTHSHAEHTSGMGAFPEGTTFIASKPVADELAATRGFGGMAKLAPAIGELLTDATLRAPDVVFDREHRLDLGGVHVRLMFLGPTHTAGDTLALVEEDGTLYAGDVVVVKRFPSFGPQSRYATWIEVLNKVQALSPKLIVPSHGARGDVSAVDVQRRVMTEMHDRVAALKRDGRSLEDATKMVVGEFQAKYPDWRATIPNEIGPIVRSMHAE